MQPVATKMQSMATKMQPTDNQNATSGNQHATNMRARRSDFADNGKQCVRGLPTSGKGHLAEELPEPDAGGAVWHFVAAAVSDDGAGR